MEERKRNSESKLKHKSILEYSEHSPGARNGEDSALKIITLMVEFRFIF